MKKIKTFRAGSWYIFELDEIRKGDIIMKEPVNLLFTVTDIHKGDRDTPTQLSLDMLKRQPSVWKDWEEK